MQDFRNLNVWQLAHRLTLDVYQATDQFPPDERYGLRSQLRRSFSSIGANLAEGCGRGTPGEPHRSIQIAIGSAYEAENHLILCRDLRIMDDDPIDRLLAGATELKKLLVGLKKTVNSGASGRRSRSATHLDPHNCKLQTAN